jgi:hypothetical protein
MSDPAVLSIGDFCGNFRISRTQTYKAIKNKELIVFKRGRRTFITRAAADAWLANLTAGQEANHHG